MSTAEHNVSSVLILTSCMLVRLARRHGCKSRFAVSGSQEIKAEGLSESKLKAAPSHTCYCCTPRALGSCSCVRHASSATRPHRTAQGQHCSTRNAWNRARAGQLDLFKPRFHQWLLAMSEAGYTPWQIRASQSTSCPQSRPFALVSTRRSALELTRQVGSRRSIVPVWNSTWTFAGRSCFKLF